MDADVEQQRRTLAEFVGLRVRHSPAPESTAPTDRGARIDQAGYVRVERAEPDRYRLSRHNPTDRAMLDHTDPDLLVRALSRISRPLNRSADAEANGNVRGGW